MTKMHYIINSNAIEDTDANVLEWVNKYIEELKSCEGRVVFMRVPLHIQRGVKSFDPPGMFATVYARWSAVDDLLPRHARSCSNQNVLNPVGAYIGVEECGCRTPSIEPAEKSPSPKLNDNDTPIAVRRVVMSWFP